MSRSTRVPPMERLHKNKKFFLKKKSDKQTEQNHHCKNLYSINGFSILLFSLCENVPQGQ